VRTLEGKKSGHDPKHTVEHFLASCTGSASPTLLVIEEPYYAQARLSKRLSALTRAITAWGRLHGAKVCSYIPPTVKARFCDGKPTRCMLAEAVARRHPFLERFRRPTLTPRARLYWQQMFEAVALGIVAISDQATKKPRIATLGGVR
jgi:hypothetical protein